MKVLVAMSGGVDSSLAAALLAEAGHEVTGATMKLWGGPSDSGCCSVADVTDARRVCDDLGIDHRVFNFTDEFATDVVEPFVTAHAAGRTPNPCVACNTELKFGHFLSRARRLGFDAVATGHHARVRRGRNGASWLERGADAKKDQSYVLAPLGHDELSMLVLPVGEMTKDEVRAGAAARSIRVATKPDSQDVCFITSRSGGSGRRGFLAERMELHPGTLLDAASGERVGETDALELLTIGQRRGTGAASASERRYVVELDVEGRTARVGSSDDLLVNGCELSGRTWSGGVLEPGEAVEAQASAHGTPRPAHLTASGIEYVTPERKVAPGQLVALYRDDRVVGSGIAS